MKAEDLRKSILQAAVEGKLVTQDKNDEPASELLKRIEHEKACLDKEGKLKRTKPLPPITDDETPYDLPDGWVWCRLGFIGDVRGGKRIPKGMSFSKYPTTHIYIRVTDMKNGTISDQNICYIGEDVFQQISRYTISKDDVYITIAGTIGDCGTVPAKFDGMNLTENAAKLSVFGAYKDYIVKAIASPLVQAQFTEKTNQMAQPKLALERIKSTIIPYPPIAEQQRIVAKVDELMALCDKLETAETELNVLEDHLTEDLPKSILQAAVQGKLVPHDKKDEPASELLKRIQAEKSTLIEEGKLKRERPLPPITEDEIPYDLPNGWVWCRISEIHQIIRGITFPAAMKQHHNAEGLVCCATTGSVQRKYNFSADVFVPVRYVRRDNQWLQDNDIIMSTANSRELVGKSCIWHGKEQKTFGGFLTVLRTQGKIVSQYSYYVFQHLQASGAFNISSTQTTNIANISNETLGITLYPLPPLAEQQRIVAKVDELMALCEELKHVEDKPFDYSNVIPLPVPTETEPLQMVAQGKVAKVQSVKHRAAIKDLLKMMDDE